MTFTSCCSISCPNDREKLGRLWGNYLARDVRNSFKLIPILTPGSPLRLRTLLQLRPHQLPPHVPSTFGFHRTTCDYALFRSYFGTDCFAGAATRRPSPTDTTLSPTPSAKDFIRVIRFLRSSRSLASFAPSLSLTSGQIVRGQTQYASFGQPGTDRFVRRLCTPLLRRIRRKLRRFLSRPPKISVSDFRSNGALRFF